MTQHEASRTLVKSPPELWAECSDADSLARHLDQFGEIQITRLEPETAVAWEGELASGTVRLEPSGWGTRVILTAEAAGVTEIAPAPPVAPEPEVIEKPVPEPEVAEPAPPEPVAEVDVEPVADPVGEVDPDPDPDPLPPAAVSDQPKGFMGRLRRWFSGPPASRAPVEPEPAAAAPEPELLVGVPAIAEPEPVETEPVESSPAAPDPLPVQPEPVPVEPEPLPPAASNHEQSSGTAIDASAALTAALDSLGQAHHRPFSRA